MAISSEAVRQAWSVWQRQLREADERLAFARDWATYVEDHIAALSGKFADFVNLVAATRKGLASDDHFGDDVDASVHFDLLILEEAHEMTEAEFLKLARRRALGPRWGTGHRHGRGGAPSSFITGVF